jgi:hypothetical protein
MTPLAHVFVLPVIRREDFDTFKRDVGLNPTTTFDQWQKLFESEAAGARRQGRTVLETEINYTEFKQFCSNSGRKPTPQTLLEFAMHRPRGEA